MPFALLLAVVALFPACSDDEPEAMATIEYHEWYAAGNDVAPLFRAFPLSIDSIYLRIRVHVPNILAPDSVLYRIYIEKYQDDVYEPVYVVTGKDQPGWGALFDKSLTEPDSIISFTTTNAMLNDADRTLVGIYKEYDDEDPPVMKVEYVYIHANWPTPPDPELGFGSTGNFEYGNDNVHHFTRYFYEPDETR